MNSILDKIAQRKLEEVALAKQVKPLSSLPKTPPLPIRDFSGALQDDAHPAVIAEIKKASPSKGVIRADFDVARIAQIYETHKARCLSVLTDVDFFQGHPDYLAIAKKQVSIPVLRKDFIIDPYQIYESYALGADCILLIVALLDDVQLMEYYKLAQELGMAVLVESHSQSELERALQLDHAIIGINNRSLHSFKTDIQLSIDLKKQIPQGRTVVSESGINSSEDIARMKAHGIHVFLIGESLMRSADIGAGLDLLLG